MLEYGYKGALSNRDYVDLDVFANLCDWARLFGKYEHSATPPIKRFAIGVYQLGQCLAWNTAGDKLNTWEAAASHNLHIVAAVEMLGGDVSAHLPCRHTDIEYHHRVFDKPKYLDYLLSAQRYIVYGQVGADTERSSSRFDDNSLSSMVAGMVRCVGCLLPRDTAGVNKAYDAAIEIACGKL